MNPKEEARSFIRVFGNNAYEKAISFAVESTRMNDTEGSIFYGDVAKELMFLGYHRKGKNSCSENYGENS